MSSRNIEDFPRKGVENCWRSPVDHFVSFYGLFVSDHANVLKLVYNKTRGCCSVKLVIILD